MKLSVLPCRIGSMRLFMGLENFTVLLPLRIVGDWRIILRASDLSVSKRRGSEIDDTTTKGLSLSNILPCSIDNYQCMPPYFIVTINYRRQAVYINSRWARIQKQWRSGVISKCLSQNTAGDRCRPPASFVLQGSPLTSRVIAVTLECNSS